MTLRDALDMVLIVAGVFSPTGAVIAIYRMRGQKGIDLATEKEITERIAASQDEREAEKFALIERQRLADKRIADERFEMLLDLSQYVNEDIYYHRQVAALLTLYLPQGVEAPTPPALPPRRVHTTPGETST